jgi:phenylacetate-coenzyme A ligase PaaK-like adenylate-forming protein
VETSRGAWHNVRMEDRVRLVDGKHRCLPASYVPRVRGGTLEKLTNGLLAAEWLPPEVIRERQLDRLRRLLCHAAEHSPFHARRMAAAGFEPSRLKSLDDLQRLPSMTRRDVQSGFDDILSRRLPGRTVFIGEKATSGTSGVPVRVRVTNTHNTVWTAVTLRNYVWTGVAGDSRVAGIRELEGEACDRPEGLDLPTWGGLLGRSFKTGRASALHIGMDLPTQTAFLRGCNPQMLLTASWNMTLLGDYIHRHGVRLPGLRVLHGMGDAVTDGMRERMEEAFGVPFFDTYSCSELGNIASMCPEGHGYHVHDEAVVIEVVDDQGSPCEAGHTGRLLVTCLSNCGFPMIRYALGDDIVAGPTEPCPCGRGLSRIGGIVGRVWHQFVTTEGQQISTHPASALIRGTGHLRQFQVVQHTRKHIEVLIVPDTGFGREQQDQIGNGLRAYLGGDLRVTFSVLDEIRLAASGKHTAFVCNAT